MPEFIEFVKACGTVILPLVAIILSIGAMCVSLVSMFFSIRCELARIQKQVKGNEEREFRENKKRQY